MNDNKYQFINKEKQLSLRIIRTKQIKNAISFRNIAISFNPNQT